MQTRSKRNVYCRGGACSSRRRALDHKERRSRRYALCRGRRLDDPRQDITECCRVRRLNTRVRRTARLVAMTCKREANETYIVGEGLAPPAAGRWIIRSVGREDMRFVGVGASTTRGRTLQSVVGYGASTTRGRALQSVVGYSADTRVQWSSLRQN